MKLLNNFPPRLYAAFCESEVVLVEDLATSVVVRALIWQLIENEEQRKRQLQTQSRLSETGQARLAAHRECAAHANSLFVINCGTQPNIPYFQDALRKTRTPYVVVHTLNSKPSKFRQTNLGEPWTYHDRIWYEIVAAHQEGIFARRYTFQGYRPLHGGCTHSVNILTQASQLSHAVAV